MLQKHENLFDLKWNNFAAHLTELSSSLLQDSTLLDISIQCGTEVVRAHRLVLSACSPWFREVIINMQANPSPLVVLWETKMVDMKNILSFMYNGEVQVEHDSLLSFLKLAGYLQVKGLTQGNENKDVAEQVMEEEMPVMKKPEVEETTHMSVEDPKSRETIRPTSRTSRPMSRVAEPSKSRNETTSEIRLTKEDFDLSKKKQVIEYSEERSGNSEKNVIGKSDFDIKSDYERSKVRDMRLKEVMKNAGTHKSLDRPLKKKQQLRKNSFGQQFKAPQSSKPLHNKPKETIDNEERLLEAMLERRSMLEKIGNAPLSRFENTNDDDEYNPDFDPSLLVKTEIDETMEEEVLDTSGPSTPFSHSPTTSLTPNTSSNTPTSDMCNICGKGPFAKGKVSQHMKNVHSGMLYECTTCVKTFKCERYLQNHKRQYCPDRFKQ